MLVGSNKYISYDYVQEIFRYIFDYSNYFSDAYVTKYYNESCFGFEQ